MNCRRPLLPTSSSHILQRRRQVRPLITRLAECNRVDNLATLNALLDRTTEAEGLASEIEKSERLRSLVVEIRSKAKEECDRYKPPSPEARLTEPNTTLYLARPPI